MCAGVSHKDSFGVWEVEKVDPSIPAFQVPFKNSIIAIRTSKCPFITVHFQCGLTLAGCVRQATDIKIVRVPVIAVVLQVSESSHYGSKPWVISSERLDLSLD